MIFPNDKKPSSAENTKGRNDDNETDTVEMTKLAMILTVF